MKKAEAEPAIRFLATRWFREAHPGVADPSTALPIFEDFVRWVRDQGGGHYFEFRSVMGWREDAERWFDQELKQVWRN